MSNLSIFEYDNSQIRLGQPVYVLAGNSQTGTTLSDTLLSSTYVKNNATVAQSAFPALYSQMGLIPGAPWTARISGTTQQLICVGYGNGIYLYGTQGGALGTSTDAITWTVRTSGTVSQINAITYGTNYVAGGVGGVLLTSTDSITWTVRTSGTVSSILSLTYGNSLYVYGTAGGGLATSTDAITWTARTSGIAGVVQTLVYANSLYVYGGASGAIATSTDAITWTARTSGITTTSINSITYGSGLYAYVAFNGQTGTSTDAITWTAGAIVITGGGYSLAYGNGLFVAGYGSGAIITSTNATNWTARTSAVIGNVNGLVYGNNLFVQVSASGTIGTSAPITTTSFYMPTATNTVYALTQTSGYSAATLPVYYKGVVSNSIDVPLGTVMNVYDSTTNGTTIPLNSNNIKDNAVYLQSSYPDLYAQIGQIGAGVGIARVSGTVSNILATAYLNGIYLYGTQGGANLATSTDAITWATQTTPFTTPGITAITYGASQYVYAAAQTGVNPKFVTSTDAITWSVSATIATTTSFIYNLIYGGGLFVYGGIGATMGTSTDAVTWTTRTPGAVGAIVGLTYGNSIYVLGGTGVLSTSTDAITWTARTANTASQINSVIYTGSLFAYGDAKGYVGTSTDAITWGTPQPTGLASVLQLVYNAGTYAAINGAAPAQVATSTNLINWTIKSVGSGALQPIGTSLIYGNGKYVINGGTGGLGYLYTSTDLVTNVYSPYYNVATEFLVPKIDTVSATAIAGQPDIQQVYIKAK